ncbi:tyrosine-type recombinase/integrase [Pseudomonas putida]|uniref:tyrosine-type recombinase/integrase n=1 Tax=Pseudomonas putida TaxID=303 RepID=UPI0022DE898C|nr:tyrosine-type recombinase/integrase [Pseudomonas putida]WBM44669.1 tyrosine-type recombinase/integrase [Pseudomonas putida]
MKVLKVKEIEWSGVDLTSWSIVRKGGLTASSLVAAPCLYLLTRAQASKEDNSQKANAEDLRTLFEHLDNNNLDWRYLRDKDITDYIHQELVLRRCISEESIERHISTLRGFYGFGWECGLMSTPPNFSYNYKKRNHKHQDKSSNPANFDLRSKFIDGELFKIIKSGIIAASPYIRERNELVISLSYFCGLRTSEVTDPRNLNTLDIKKALERIKKNKTHAFTINIYGKGNKLRSVDVPPQMSNLIRNFVEGRRSSIIDGPLICSNNGSPLHKSHASNVFKDALRSAAFRAQRYLQNSPEPDNFVYHIPNDSYKNLTFHCLRHTFATNLVDFCYKHGIDPWQHVPEQMGHSRLATTKIYITFDALIHRREHIMRALEQEAHD